MNLILLRVKFYTLKNAHIIAKTTLNEDLMGRPKKQIDDAELLKMRGEGKFLKEISKELKTSERTLSRRIAYLQHNEGLLTKYRQLQRLDLTALQARMLAAIDFDHLEKASIVDLANACYVIEKVLISIREKEFGKKGGLVDHLLVLESQK